jgi:hypothetical protein
MSGYRDPYDPLDPATDPRDPAAVPGRRSEMRTANSGWGWIAGPVFVIIVLALIFGFGESGNRSASPTGNWPAATTGAAPPASPATAPRTTIGQNSGQ